MKEHLFCFLSVGLGFGIFVADTISIPNSHVWVISAVLLIALLACFKFFKKWNSIVLFIMVVLFGFIRHEHFNKVNILNISDLNTVEVIKFTVLKTLNSSKKHYKYIAQLENNNRTKVLLYQKKESGKLSMGKAVWVKAKIDLINEPKNPHQFNYKQYLERKKIYYQCYVNHVLSEEEIPWNLGIYKAQFKETLKKKLLDSGANQNNSQLVSALILGDRSDFSQEQKEQFSKAGVMHLLAISGLHVGIIFSLIYFIFSSLKLIGKKGRIFISLIVIWCFTYFVDFSPSVSRASLMLSLYYGAKLLNREPNLYYTLALTAFILLLINPNFLFDVGFQLSFSAVFFIAYLFPIWLKFVSPKPKLIQYFSDLTGVSICAQLGVLPFSIYYFHQFSALFLIGNLVLIPTAYLLVFFGFIELILVLFFPELNWLVTLYNYISNQVFNFIESLSSFNLFIFSDLFISPLQTILLFLILPLVRYFILSKKLKYFAMILGVLALFQIERLSHIYSAERKKELIAFQQYKNQIIALREGRKLYVFVENLNDSINIEKYILKPYKRVEHIKKAKLFPLEKELSLGKFNKTKNFISYKQELFYVGEEIPKNTNKLEKLFISNLNFKNVCNEFQMNQIITHSYYELDSCKSVWNLNQKGAFIYQFNK